MTSWWRSGPPKESTSSASRRRAGAGSADGGTPPLLRTASDGSSSGRCPAGVMSTVARGTAVLLSQVVSRMRSHAHGVEASVDVHDHAGGGGESVREQRDDGPVGAVVACDPTAEWCAAFPRLLALAAAGDV